MRNSDFQLTIKLKQHTPIIHFQHDQEGATLRATEVKPKLDRFIIEKLGGLGKLPSGWKGNNKDADRPSLNYKLECRGDGITTSNIPERFPCFFANLGTGDGDKKKFSLAKGGVEVRVFSFQADLVKKIDEVASEFFAYENFGTRQSKGFGSFTRIDKGFNFSGFYSFTVESDRYSELFSTIDFFYKSIRGGINGIAHPNPIERWQRGFEQEFYMKPMIFLFAASKEIEWEKKAIKARYFSGKLDKQQDKFPLEPEEEPAPLHFKGKQRIVRDLFGLATNQTWGKEYGNAEIEKSDASATEKNKGIERMKSILFFKPVLEGNHYRVYFREKVDAKALETFRSSKFKIQVNKSGSLELPVWNDFSISDFFKFAFQEVRVENSMNFPDTDRAISISEELIRIYTEIRQSINYVG